MNKILVLSSGGIDSTTLVYYFAEIENFEVQPVFFNYGSKHNPKEIESVKQICNILNLELINVDISELTSTIWSNSALINEDRSIPEGYYTQENMSQTIVPFRNGVLISLVSSIAENLGIEYVGIAVHSGDHFIYPDCRPNFIQVMKYAIYRGTENNIKLRAPFVYLNKAEIVKLGYFLRVPYELTWSCYNGRDKHCGRCGTCIERLESFHFNNLTDPVEYEDREYFKNIITKSMKVRSVSEILKLSSSY